MAVTLMNWAQLMSPLRFDDPDGEPIRPDTADPYRSDFHIDYDRLVFSHAFRRLGRKTQVHPLAQHDHTHNRLTHSMEVSSVGRSLGRTAAGLLAQAGQLPPDTDINDFGIVVQVACLAHDLGNPPFGHVGEEALRDWFRQPEHAVYLDGLSDAERRDIQTYEGNAHSLRQTARLEMYRNRGGMRLTAAASGSLLKYPWTSSHANAAKGKFNIYQSELPFARRIAAALGLPEQSPDCWARHPLSYLMEAADDICYALMDLEDAIDLELLGYDEVAATLSALVPRQHDSCSRSRREHAAMMRGRAIGAAVDEAARTFMHYQPQLLNGELPAKDLISLCSAPVRDTLDAAKDLARRRVFRHRSKVVHSIAAFPCLGLLLDTLIPAAHSLSVSGSLSPRQSLALSLLDDEPLTAQDTPYTAYMKVLDFVGGMTDNHAARLARELSGFGMA